MDLDLGMIVNFCFDVYFIVLSKDTNLTVKNEEKQLVCLVFLLAPLLVGIALPYWLLKPSINSGIMPFWYKLGV